MASETTEAPVTPIGALLSRYMKREKLSAEELGRRTSRSSAAVRQILYGESAGLKSWRGDSLLFMLARALEIPERELRKAIADHYQQQAADSLLAATKSARNTRRRSSKTCYPQPVVEQRELAYAAGL